VPGQSQSNRFVHRLLTARRDTLPIKSRKPGTGENYGRVNAHGIKSPQRLCIFAGYGFSFNGKPKAAAFQYAFRQSGLRLAIKRGTQKFS
jgi:hypothetical protein